MIKKMKRGFNVLTRAVGNTMLVSLGGIMVLQTFMGSLQGPSPFHFTLGIVSVSIGVLCFYWRI